MDLFENPAGSLTIPCGFSPCGYETYILGSAAGLIVPKNGKRIERGPGRRDTFYKAPRYTFSRFLHEDRSAFIVFIWGTSLTADTLNCLEAISK
jgi:hypothetical protein